MNILYGTGGHPWTFRRGPAPHTRCHRPSEASYREVSSIAEARANGATREEEAVAAGVAIRAARRGSSLPDPYNDPWDGAPNARRGRTWKAHRAHQHKG